MTLGRRTLARTGRSHFTLRIARRRLAVGRNRVHVVATDRLGRRVGTTVTLHRCRPPRRQVLPNFTG